MNGGLFFLNNDGVYTSVGHVSEVDLDTETTDFAEKLEFTCKIECDPDAIAKAVLPRGEYNAHVLKRDGYLDERNASL